MRFIEIKNLVIENLENAGCNNGNYPHWSGINAITGESMSGITCRCTRGCSNTDDLHWDWRKPTEGTLIFED